MREGWKAPSKGLLRRPSPGRPLIAALTYPRRTKYIKSRKQRAERNATAVTFRAPPPLAHLRAVLAAAGGARGWRGCGPRGRRTDSARPARRRRCGSPTPTDRRREERRGSRVGTTVFARPPPPPDISKGYFGVFEN